MWPLVAMLGLSALKNEQDQKSYQGQSDVAAATQRYSPWTHMQASAPQKPNQFGTLTQGLGTGLAMQQAYDKAYPDKPETPAAPSAGGGGALSLGTTDRPMYATDSNQAGAPDPYLDAMNKGRTARLNGSSPWYSM